MSLASAQQLVEKMRRDATLRERFGKLQNREEALTLLAELGLEEFTDAELNQAMTGRDQAAQLSEAELEKVAGGGDMGGCCNRGFWRIELYFTP